MGEQISRPSGDVATCQWNIQPSSPTSHYTKIDENWPGNTSDYIHETVNGQVDKFSFPADGPAAMVTVHTVHHDVYMNTTNIAQIPGLVVFLYRGTTYITSRTYQIDTGGAWKRYRLTFDGLSLTKAQYNTLRIHLLTAVGAPGWPIPEREF